MKRTLLFLFVAPLLATAQSFHRGAIILDVGTGFEYLTTQKTYFNTTSQSDTTVKDNAASYNFNAGLEVGIKKRIGISARGRLNTFFSDLDNVVKDRGSMKSMDLMTSISIHPISRKRFDLSLGTDLGMSNMSLSFKTVSQLNAGGTGFYGAVFIMPRFYWKRVGFHVRVTLPYVNYGQLKATSELANTQNLNLSKMSASGYGVSAGVQLRIL